MAKQTIGAKLLRPLLKQTLHKELLKSLDNITFEQLNPDWLCEEFKKGLANHADYQTTLASIDWTDEDTRDVLKSVIPKLRKEKEKRLKRGV